MLPAEEAEELARMALPQWTASLWRFNLSWQSYLSLRDLNEGFPVERFKADYVISWMLANYPPA
ncbi:hypothetical protein [Raoultella planticola]|uniref:hypothetical protein n=1 Tax=Raoultella planticola TaxID=575 RepID=UPI00187D28E0|nr:hypothetical protein [Raoultella planticola]